MARQVRHYGALFVDGVQVAASTTLQAIGNSTGSIDIGRSLTNPVFGMP
jgi:hypothetical protein